eukprot:m.165904 g.165904  ORF g.165904 m.165904 type:complete len:555 (+) comp17163_c0_seq1:474-2138(+)
MSAGKSFTAAELADMDERRDKWAIHKKEIHSGWLTKRGGRHKSWKKRWFSIRGSQMLYYKDPSDNKPLGVITLCHPLEAKCLREVRILPDDEEAQLKRRFCFELRGVGDQRVYYCCASDANDLERWVDALRRVIYFPLGGGMFGTDLTIQVQRERRLNSPIPIIVEMCVNSIRNNGLDEVGLFRLPGRTTRVRELKDAFNRGEQPDLLQETEVHAVASLLKQYLRELPAPLLTFEKFDSFLSAVKIYNVDHDEGLRLVKELATSLPPCNSTLLQYLCKFLRDINERSSVNKMNLANLATVFAPNFLLPKEQDVHELMENTSSVHAITCILIEHQDKIFAGLSPSDMPALFAAAKIEDDMLPDLDSEDEDEGEDRQTKGFSIASSIAAAFSAVVPSSLSASSSTSSLPPAAAAAPCAPAATPMSPPPSATSAAATPGANNAAAMASGLQGPVRLIQQDLLRERELRQALEIHVEQLEEKCRRLEAMLGDEHDRRIIAESQLKTIIEKLPRRGTAASSDQGVAAAAATAAGAGAGANAAENSDEMFNLLDLASMRR